MNTQKQRFSDKQKAYLFLLSLLILMIFSIIKTNYSSSALEKNHRYTIAYGNGISYGDGGTFFRAYYTVNGIRYNASIVVLPEDKNVYKFGRYYMKYNPDDVGGLIDVLFESPVPDSIIQAPDTGWVEIPK